MSKPCSTSSIFKKLRGRMRTLSSIVRSGPYLTVREAIAATQARALAERKVGQRWYLERRQRRALLLVIKGDFEGGGWAAPFVGTGVATALCTLAHEPEE